MIDAIRDLARHGQSVWYDGLKRDLIRSGSLARLIEDGVRGLTTNPSIYEKAIGGRATTTPISRRSRRAASTRRRSTRRWRSRTCARRPTSCARSGTRRTGATAS